MNDMISSKLIGQTEAFMISDFGKGFPAGLRWLADI
jgi:hypothetical protein